MMKVSSSCTGRLSNPAGITMEIKKMSGGFFLLKTSKETKETREEWNLPDFGKVDPFRQSSNKINH